MVNTKFVKLTNLSLMMLKGQIVSPPLKADFFFTAP